MTLSNQMETRVSATEMPAEPLLSDNYYWIFSSIDRTEILEIYGLHIILSGDKRQWVGEVTRFIVMESFSLEFWRFCYKLMHTRHIVTSFIIDISRTSPAKKLWKIQDTVEKHILSNEQQKVWSKVRYLWALNYLKID